MDPAEEYLRRAREAELQAAHTADPGMRKSFLDLARQWRNLAGDADGAKPIAPGADDDG